MEAILLKISDVAASRFNSYFPLVFAVTKPTWAVTQLVVMLPHPCWFHSLFHKIPSKTIQGRYIDQAIPPTILWWPPTRTTKQPRTRQGWGHQDWLIDQHINRQDGCNNQDCLQNQAITQKQDGCNNQDSVQNQAITQKQDGCNDHHYVVVGPILILKIDYNNGTLTWMVWSQHPGFISYHQGSLPHIFHGC